MTDFQEMCGSLTSKYLTAEQIAALIDQATECAADGNGPERPSECQALVSLVDSFIEAKIVALLSSGPALGVRIENA